MGLCPAFCKCINKSMGTRLPICKLSDVGSKPIYPVVISLDNWSLVPGIISWIIPLHCSSSIRFILFNMSFFAKLRIKTGQKVRNNLNKSTLDRVNALNICLKPGLKLFWNESECRCSQSKRKAVYLISYRNRPYTFENISKTSFCNLRFMMKRMPGAIRLTTLLIKPRQMAKIYILLILLILG